jgi:hypothetical protein
MTRRPGTRIAIGIAALAALAGTLAAPAVTAGNGRGALPQFIETTDTTPVTVRIAGHTFVIPLNYFRHPPRRDGGEDDGFLLRVLLPDLEPYTAENAEAFREPGFGRKMNILLHDERIVRPLNEILRSPHFGTTELSQPSLATHGLAHGINEKGEDIYASYNSGELVAVLRCQRLQPQRSPPCEHYFGWKSFDVRVHYHLDYYPNWKLIQNKVENLLSSFLMQSPASKEENKNDAK